MIPLDSAIDQLASSFSVTFDTFGSEGQMSKSDPEMIEKPKALGCLPGDSP